MALPPPDVAARECDRELLARAQACAPAIRRRSLELARLLPAWHPLAGVAEDVARLLEEPRGVRLAYYPATPVAAGTGAAWHAGFFLLELKPRRGGPPRRLPCIVLFQPCKAFSDPELRCVLAHELAHAADHRIEEVVYDYERALSTHFPADFRSPYPHPSLLLSRPGTRAVAAEELGALAEKRPAEFLAALRRCWKELQPVEG